MLVIQTAFSLFHPKRKSLSIFGFIAFFIKMTESMSTSNGNRIWCLLTRKIYEFSQSNEPFIFRDYIRKHVLNEFQVTVIRTVCFSLLRLFQEETVITGQTTKANYKRLHRTRLYKRRKKQQFEPFWKDAHFLKIAADELAPNSYSNKTIKKSNVSLLSQCSVLLHSFRWHATYALSSMWQ